MVPAPNWPDYPDSPPSTLSWTVTVVLLVVGFGSFFLAYFGPGYALFGRVWSQLTGRGGESRDGAGSIRLGLTRACAMFAACGLLVAARDTLNRRPQYGSVEACRETCDEMETQVCDLLPSPPGPEIAPNGYRTVAGYGGSSYSIDPLFLDKSVAESVILREYGMAGSDCPVDLPQWLKS
ncbi:MAG: hypothetical protein LBD97_04275 [Bifidobacteriaceae bacterium]|jgi:hypothetical protein|nr:hypothetical protein [Bifidobacteriaceae bacterium]